MDKDTAVIATRAEYKGHRTISLAQEGSKFPFSFGLQKAKLILASIAAIQEFVRDEEAAAAAKDLAKETKKVAVK